MVGGEWQPQFDEGACILALAILGGKVFRNYTGIVIEKYVKKKCSVGTKYG
jgi:hypothetical protein